MKTICISLLFLLTLPAVSLAQTQYQDVVYLKTGAIIHGLIIEQVPNKTIKIQKPDGDVFVFQMDEIEKITKEPLLRRQSDNEYDPGAEGSGYAGYLLAGIDHILSGASGELVSLHFVNGSHINRSTLGFGVGAEFPTDGESLFLIPLWLDVRTFFGDGTTKPFLWSHLGYSFADLSGNVRSEGFSYGGGLGVKFQGSGAGFMMDLGYRVQDLAFGSYGAIELHLGLAF